MRSSLVALVLGAALVVLLLVFGLNEARTRQKRSERLDDMEEKINDLEARVKALEGKAKK
jgi:hypothetical protein